MAANKGNETGSDILKRRKASIKNAPLPPGSPTWDQIEQEKWRGIVRKAKKKVPGYKTIRKLLTDKRFDKP
jgi:hypothetical protein